MSITDFSFSQVGLPRPQSWTRNVLTQLPIRCQHYLVCLVLHKCTLLISGHIGWEMKQTMLAFRSRFYLFNWIELNFVLLLFYLPFFVVTLMLLSFFLFVFYPLILLGLMNDGKGWSLRQNRKVAPVSALEGFSFTFPSAKVCVNHRVLCFK